MVGVDCIVGCPVARNGVCGWRDGEYEKEIEGKLIWIPYGEEGVVVM